MLNVKTASIATLLSFVALAIGGVSALQAIQRKPIEVAYQDLHPDARRQVDCLADNIYFEARSEPTNGQKAVALVTMNRVSSGSFAPTVCGVVKQVENSTCQFSWWCDTTIRAKAVHRQFHHEAYQQARLIALDVYLNYERIHDITKGALFYHAEYVPKSKIGVPNLQMTVKIGQHIFYRT